MPSSIRILLVEDDRANCLVLKEVLERWQYVVKEAYSGEDAIRLGSREAFDIVLSDIRMEPVDGLQVLKAFRRTQPEVPVIMMTGFGSVDTAVEAIKAGAFDYISKPFRFDEIRLTLSRAAEQRRAQAVSRRSPDEQVPDERVTLIGHSRVMAEIYKTIAKASTGRSTVLVVGESGTGKELVARAIHRNSDRAAKPFLAINCAALPDELLESELFGYARGAHSTATTDKPGMFELANGGTLLLDEIGDMSPSLQAKLLRVLEESETRRLGDTRTIHTDVRVIASTNKDLVRMVRENRFREDLYYRLNVITITLPPLRERREDIPHLTDHFIKKYSALVHKNVVDASPEALDRLQAFAWPGNVRELEHVIERAVILNTKSRIMPEDLPDDLRSPPADAPKPPASAPPLSLHELERQHILQALRERHGNIKATAESLGIDRKTLYRKLAEYGVDVDHDAKPDAPEPRPQ
jgi:DNA-binding NtrC family response regulator